jgi:hypothetical protein
MSLIAGVVMPERAVQLNLFRSAPGLQPIYTTGTADTGHFSRIVLMCRFSVQ